MSIKPLLNKSSSDLNRMLKRLMRRQGVAIDVVPSFEDWNNFVLAVDQIIKENDTKLKEYLSGKEKLFGFFIGQVMKKTNGKANPKIVNQVLTDTIKKHR